MNKAVPWRIKGVPFDARAAAIEAARRSGLSLGEWLNSVIAEQAAAEGLDEANLDRDAELDAVTHRLMSLRDETCDDGRVGGRALPPRKSRRAAWRDDSEADNERDAGKIARRAPRDEIDAEALLENAIAAFDRRANRSSERTARALAQVADLIDSSNRERDREESALSTIADRLSGLERRVAQPAAAPPRDSQVHDALARLEKRIELLGQPVPAAPLAPPPAAAPPVHVPPAAAPLAASPAAPPVRVARANVPARRPLAAAIAEVARRQRELDADEVAAPAPSPRPVAAARAETQPNPLEMRLAALVDRLERSAARRPEPARAPDITGLQGNIDSLTDRIERMRGDIAARNAATDRPADGIGEIRRELAAMSRVVSDLAPRASVVALEDAVRDLTARIEDSRLEGVGESALAPVESLTREILQVVRASDSRAAIQSLDRGIQAVTARLEAFDGATVADPDLARGIAEQTREMRDTLARILANQVPAERIERELADLGGRVEAMIGAGADPLGRGEMAQRVGEIRAMLADPFSQERSLQVLERRLEAIASRVDAVFGERFDTMQRTLSAQFEQARASAGATPGVETLVEDLGARIDRALTGGLAAMERKVARLVESAAPKSDPTPSHLENMVRDLAARIDAGAGADARPDALDAIQQQIARLSDHFDRSDRTAETLVSLQQSVADLFERLEQSHDSAIGRAELAARRVAAEIVRAGDGGPSGSTAQELSDIRSLQDVADQRTHATLTAVHDTLAQVVHRLTSLEDDLAEVRADVPEPPPAIRPQPVPPIGRTPMRAAQDQRTPAAPSRNAHDARTTHDARTAHDDDVLIEPGAFGRRGDATDDERPEYRPQASFIQAARRAAQAAGAPADALPEAIGKRPAASETGGGTVAALDTVRAYYASRKRPILLSLAALMMIFGAWQVAKVVVDDRPAAPAMQAPKTSTAPAPREKVVADRPAMPTAVEPRVEADTSARKADLATPPPAEPVPALPTASASPAPSASIGAFDRMPVGSIARAEPSADTNGIVRALAISGDSAAQYELAVRYADGKLLARDPKLSTQWFEKAAGQGLAPAQYRLGAAYERGVGVTKDLAAARQWYARAADGGNARAMHNLAVLYADGTDNKANYAEAITWFRRAAELGVRDSQFNLAILYARGLGTPVNMVESYIWFSAAATQGDDDAAKKRDDVATRLPANDVARAKALAAAFKAKPIDAAANDVPPPPGGWESMKAPPRPEGKSAVRPKMSNL